MSVLVIQGLSDGWIQFDDGSGPNELPTDRIHIFAYGANQSDDAGLTICGRFVGRDTLIALRSYLDDMDRCGQCREEPATQDMGDGSTFCAGCCSAAAGSAYDDREVTA